MKSRPSFSKLGSNGRITIPKRIREALGLQPGDRVRFVEHQGDMILEPVKASLRDYEGSVEPSEQPESFADVSSQVKRHRADKDDSD